MSEHDALTLGAHRLTWTPYPRRLEVEFAALTHSDLVRRCEEAIKGHEPVACRLWEGDPIRFHVASLESESVTGMTRVVLREAR